MVRFRALLRGGLFVSVACATITCSPVPDPRTGPTCDGGRGDCDKNAATETGRDVAVGRAHVCALGTSGHVACWGDGAAGQLGGGSRESSTAPRPIPGLADATAISAAGDGTGARRSNGEVLCWGTHEAWPRPFLTWRVEGLPSVERVVLGPKHACAVTSSGELWCWGSQLGPGKVRDSYAPVRI